jgi:cysteinyl-tRNA synthetase
VRYWEPAWRRLLWGDPGAQLDRLLASGFDGVFLDVVDAFEFWGPGGASGLGRESAARDMAALVAALAAYARAQRPGFLVVPQNGEALLPVPGYLAAIDGIAVEDLYFDGEAPVAREETTRRVALLAPARAAGKAVLVTDYTRDPARVRDLCQRARAAGFVPYATVRELDRLTAQPR